MSVGDDMHFALRAEVETLRSQVETLTKQRDESRQAAQQHWDVRQAEVADLESKLKRFNNYIANAKLIKDKILADEPFSARTLILNLATEQALKPAETKER